VGSVQERIAAQADVEEGGLDPGEDARDPGLRDAPDRKRLAVPLDPDLDGRPALAKGRPGPPRAPTDEKLARPHRGALAPERERHPERVARHGLDAEERVVELEDAALPLLLPQDLDAA